MAFHIIASICHEYMTWHDMTRHDTTWHDIQYNTIQYITYILLYTIHYIHTITLHSYITLQYIHTSIYVTLHTYMYHYIHFITYHYITHHYLHYITSHVVCCLLSCFPLVRVFFSLTLYRNNWSLCLIIHNLKMPILLSDSITKFTKEVLSINKRKQVFPRIFLWEKFNNFFLDTVYNFWSNIVYFVWIQMVPDILRHPIYTYMYIYNILSHIHSLSFW